MTINIFQVPSDACFSFVGNCGCDKCSAGSSGNGGLPPGGTVGGDYSGQARAIDICANIETIFLNSIQEWIDYLQTLNYFPSIGEDLTGQIGTDLLSGVRDNLSEIQFELFGAAWAADIKKWVVKYFDDPFPGFGGGFFSREGRTELIRLARNLPLLSGGAPMSATFIVWAATADIQALNGRIKSSAGTASYTGECAQLQRDNGREPYVPPSTETSVIVLESAAWKYTRVFSGDSEPDGGFSLDVSGSDFAGFLIRQLPSGGSGTGTIYTHSQSFTHTEGVTSLSGSVGSANRGNQQVYGSGLLNVGQVAYDDFPVTFAFWDGQTNPTNPSGATFPALGAFTGTVSGNNSLGSSTSMDVWVVTTLSGEASLT